MKYFVIALVVSMGWHFGELIVGELINAIYESIKKVRNEKRLSKNKRIGF